MSRGLKSRVAKLENVANPKEVPGIIIYFDNRVMGKDDDGMDVTVSADYYLENERGKPLTDAELEKALEGKLYVCHMPVQDKKEDVKFHVIETDTQ
jgi:hypothetical protein